MAAPWNMGLLGSDDGSGSDLVGLLSPSSRFQALMQGLMQAGAGIAKGGFAQGMQGFGEGINSGMQQGIQYGLLTDKLKETQRKREAIKAAIAGLPPEQQALAMAAPDEFFKARFKQTMPSASPTPFGMRLNDQTGGVEDVPGANDALARREAATEGAKTTAHEAAVLPYVGPKATAEEAAKLPFVGRRAAAEEAAKMPFVGPKAEAEARARSPYDIAKAWAIPRVLPPGAQVVAGGAPGGSPAQVIMTSPNPSPGSQEGRYNASVGELQGDTIKGWRSDASAAVVTKQNTGRMREALDAGLKTGTFAPVRQVAVNALRDVLREVPGATETLDRYFNPKDAKQFDSASKELVVAIAKTLGPNPTNTDRDFIEAIGPRLKDSPEAVRSLLDWMDTKAQNKIDLYTQGYEHASKGGDPLKFEQDWWQKQRSAKPATSGWSMVPMPSPTGGPR